MTLLFSCSSYVFPFVPIVIGMLRYVTANFQKNREIQSFTEKEQSRRKRILEIQPIDGSVKTCKTFQNFSIGDSLMQRCTHTE